MVPCTGLRLQQSRYYVLYVSQYIKDTRGCKALPIVWQLTTPLPVGLAAAVVSLTPPLFFLIFVSGEAIDINFKTCCKYYKNYTKKKMAEMKLLPQQDCQSYSSSSSNNNY